MAYMWSFVLFSSVVLQPNLGFDSQPQVYSQWAEVLEFTSNASDQSTQFFLGGMTQTEPDAFYISGSSTQVEKRSLKTGNVLWKAKLQAVSQSTWAFSERLLVGADTEGRVYGINRESGNIEWVYEGKGIYFSRPLIYDGRVYLINSYGVLSAFSLEDGRWLWQHSETATASLHLWAENGPQLFGGYVLAGFPSGLLLSFEPITGNRVWQESFGLAVEDSLSLNEVRSIQSQGDYLVASSYSGNIRMWKGAAGSKRLLWEKRMSLYGSAIIDLESSSVYASDRQGSLHCIDLESGYIKWTQPLKGLGTTPALGEKTVWVGTSGGFVHAFRRETGTPIGQAFPIGSPVFNSPLIFSKDEVVVFSTLGVLRRLHIFPELSAETETISLSSAF